MHAALAKLLAQPIAHRGLHACGGHGPVENSIGAALAAVEGGYAIECDIQLSEDDVPMVFHDECLERLTGTSGLVYERYSRELSDLALRGSADRIPTLTAFLQAIDGRVPVVIEIKSSGDPTRNARLARLAQAVVETYAGPVALESFDTLVVEACRKAPCPVGLVGPSEAGTDTALPQRCDFLSWSIADLAGAAQRHPTLPLTSWTIRTPAQKTLAIQHGAQIVFEGFAPDGIR